MKKIVLVALIHTIVLAACASQPTPAPTPTPVPTNTPQPTLTSIPTFVPPTATPQIIDLKSGGFSLSVQPELEFDIDDYSINLSDKRGGLIMSLNGRDYIASEYTLESFLGKYLAEMESRGGAFEQGDPYEIVIDGMSGVAIDITGSFLDRPIAGRGIIISPRENFIVFGLGMSNLAANKNEWAESGSVIFEAIIASIHFKSDVKP
jgi:hypothetical protein